MCSRARLGGAETGLLVQAFILMAILAPPALAAWASDPSRSVQAPLATAQAQAGFFTLLSTSWGTPQAPYQAGPGDLAAPFTVGLSYQSPSGASISLLQANLSLPSGFTNTSGGSWAIAYYGPLQPGSIFYLTFYLAIDSSLSTGTYEATLQIVANTSQGPAIAANMAVPINLLGKAVLSISTSTPTLSPGSVNNLSIVIANNGSGTAYNVIPSLQLQGPGAVIGQLQRVDAIPPGSSAQLPVTIYVPPSASSQPLGLLVTLSYLDPYYVQRTYSQLLGLYVAQAPSSQISARVVEPYIAAGQLNNITVVVTNRGPGGVTNLALAIYSQQLAIVGGDGRFFLGALGPGESASLRVLAYAPQQLGSSAALQIQASYQDQGGVFRSDSLSLSLLVAFPSGSFEVVSAFWGSSQGPASPAPGDSWVPLTLAAIYQGLGPAMGVEIRVSLPSWFSPSQGSCSQSLPSLQPGSSVSITCYVNIDPGAPLGSHSFNISFSWTSQDLRAHRSSSSFQLELRGRPSLAMSLLNSTINPGEASFVILLISNNGSGAAYNLSLSIATPQGISLLSPPRQWDVVPPGGSVAANLILYAQPSAAQSSASITVSATYYDPYGIVQKFSSTAGLSVAALKQAGLIAEILEGRARPGVSSKLTLRVANAGSSPAYNITVSLTAQGPGASILTPPAYVPQLLPGASATLGFTLYAPASSSGSALQILVSMSYTDQYGYQRQASQTIGVYVEQPPQPLILLSLSSQSIYAGSSTSVALAVENRGSSEVNSLVLAVTPQQPVVLVGGDGKIYVGSLKPGERREFVLTLYAPAQTAYPVSTEQASILSVVMSYTNEAGVSVTEARSLGILLRLMPLASPISLAMDPPVLVAGTINNASLRLANSGSQALANLAVGLTILGQGVSIAGPQEFSIPLLRPGESVSIPVNLYVAPAAGSSASVGVSLRYYANGTLVQESRGIGILARGIVELAVTDYTVIPETPSPGQVFSITITLTNRGTITASTVVASPDPPQGFRIFGTRSVFIGDVQVNSPTILTITLAASNSTRPGRYEVPIQLTYYNNLREPGAATVTLPVVISGGGFGSLTGGLQRPQGSQSIIANPYYVAAAAALLGIGVLAGYLIGRRRR